MASLWGLPQGQGQLSETRSSGLLIPDEDVIAISAIERASHSHQSAVRATPDHSDLRAPPGKRSKSRGDADDLIMLQLTISRRYELTGLPAWLW
jgi:hypothetical protein